MSFSFFVASRGSLISLGRSQPHILDIRKRAEFADPLLALTALRRPQWQTRTAHTPAERARGPRCMGVDPTAYGTIARMPRIQRKIAASRAARARLTRTSALEWVVTVCLGSELSIRRELTMPRRLAEVLQVIQPGEGKRRRGD
jgi:hypothetical protein